MVELLTAGGIAHKKDGFWYWRYRSKASQSQDVPYRGATIRQKADGAWHDMLNSAIRHDGKWYTIQDHKWDNLPYPTDLTNEHIAALTPSYPDNATPSSVRTIPRQPVPKGWLIPPTVMAPMGCDPVPLIDSNNIQFPVPLGLTDQYKMDAGSGEAPGGRGWVRWRNNFGYIMWRAPVYQMGFYMVKKDGTKQEIVSYENYNWENSIVRLDNYHAWNVQCLQYDVYPGLNINIPTGAWGEIVNGEENDEVDENHEITYNGEIFGVSNGHTAEVAVWPGRIFDGYAGVMVQLNTKSPTIHSVPWRTRIVMAIPCYVPSEDRYTKLEVTYYSHSIFPR